MSTTQKQDGFELATKISVVVLVIVTLPFSLLVLVVWALLKYLFK